MLNTAHIIGPNGKPKKRLSVLDRLVVFVSVVYPLSAAPQAVEVFSGHAEGVSVISWISFLFCAALFLLYGLKHKVLPMILSNILWVFMDSLVILGLLVHRFA